MSAAGLDDAFDRPAMPAAPRPAILPWSPPGSRRRTMSLGALPDDVIDTLAGWGQDASATAVVVSMVRHLREDRHAPLRAKVLHDAGEYAREQRSRVPLREG